LEPLKPNNLGNPLTQLGYRN